MKSNQAGGIVSFAVVAVVLVGLFVGGLVLSKQQGKSAREDTPTPQVSNNTEDQPSAHDENTKKETETPAAKPQPKPAAPAPSSTPQAPATNPVAITGPSNVPATGPEDVVVGILVLSTLGLAGRHFYEARRAKIDAALNR